MFLPSFPPFSMIFTTFLPVLKFFLVVLMLFSNGFSWILLSLCGSLWVLKPFFDSFNIEFASLMPFSGVLRSFSVVMTSLCGSYDIVVRCYFFLFESLDIFLGRPIIILDIVLGGIDIVF